ncbi:hypothetical protein SAMN05216371_5871 [Streptomyces sp. TLI_053]|uniref:hypothetical protein n=1 Tax=Streptomyces sp. TLI_053 TaxID=1855352 RepID=UPI00087D3265|nr:hypothetical protein [Streptomyces sp. TLI_053]SDT78902.1 hypothetical protein SAMN05216371_5871 [Streptomyces sp. TLI_053]
MSPKRGDRAAPPPIEGEYDLRFASSAAAEGWDLLTRHAPTGLRRAYEHIRSTPRATDNPSRQHQLKGKLATADFKGRELERWQYEVTSGGRIWYLVDTPTLTAWITYAGTGHPKETD